MGVSYRLKKTVFFCLAAAVGTLCVLLMPLQRELITKALIVLGFASLLFFILRRSPEHTKVGGGRFGRMEVEALDSSIRFEDIAANREALDSFRELVDYLKFPEKYLRMGARMPHGVLLYGPPGTGKTLLARALAGEAGIPFYSLSGSDFVQMYAGVGASRVRDLFEKARRAGRCVIFIDEIDSMGKARGDSSSDEREQTLNALLSEMSGVKHREGVIVLAATNRLDTLDPALTRAGRFDRHIEVGLPGKDERLDILRLHSRTKPLSPSVDLLSVAESTVRFSGAALENLMNEAAIRAARRDAQYIEQSDIDGAFVTSVAGSERPSSASREEIASIALHEAGHAIASLCLLPENRLTRITILPSTRGAAGYNLSVPAERTVRTRRQLCAQIQVLLAGRAAEMLMHDEDGITSGASNDLMRASELASAMVMDLGMSRESAVSLRALQKGCGMAPSDSLSECRALLHEQMNAAQALLERHTKELLLLTEELLKRETLTEEDIRKLLPELVG